MARLGRSFPVRALTRPAVVITPVTGTVAVTLAAVTSAASGSSVTGTVAVTLGNVTSAAAGGHGASGTTAVTLAAVTSSAAGTSAQTGTVARTLDNTTIAAAGTFTAAVTGTLAETLDNTTSAASGTFTPATVTGTVAETLDNVTSVAAGTSLVTGTVVVTLANATSTASGTASSGQVEWRSATNANVNGAASTGVTVNKPAGVVTGDVLYAFVCRGDAANTTMFTSSGWTTIHAGSPFQTTDNDRLISILRKVVTNAGTEPSSYTFAITSLGTVMAMLGIIVCVSGADTTTPEDVTLTTSHRALAINDATPNSVDITTVTDNALILQYCMLALGSSTAAKTWGPPSGYTQDANAIAVEMASSTNDLQAGVAYKTQATAGSVGTNAWTHTANDATTDYAVAVVAVRSGATVPVTGTVAATLGNATSAASGTYTPATITGTVAETLDNVTSAAAGTFTPPLVTGTVAVTLANTTSAATGTAITPVTGTVGVALDNVTSAANGTFTPLVSPDPHPAKCTIRRQRFTRRLRYHRYAERPAVDAWALNIFNQLIDFSDPDYTFTFRIGSVDTAPVLEKQTNIFGAAGTGTEHDGTPNITILWEPGELDIEPGMYQCQLIGTLSDLDEVFHGIIHISDAVS